jgi:Flp pilus assembly pilin Flp
MFKNINRFFVDDGGAMQIEYALIAILVSVAAVIALNSINTKMQSWYWNAVNNLAS